MRIERVTAHAFGPLSEQRLDLAPGMTLVYGPNEAGKSSWHAALYAGLCGMRRAKGQPILVDREFRDDHKPWDDDRWDVEVLVTLTDGRRIEIRQDLAGRVDSRATDVSLGSDVSSEIMFEGSPDGSRWLGLDRRAFLATACINQAQLLAISDDPGLLQEHIQRAAATRGTDATAAAAVERLDAFRRAQVGEDRSNSTKPLRAAKVARDRVWGALVAAQRNHEEYLALAAESDAARERADREAADLRPLVAALALHRAAIARDRADRAAGLAVRFPDGAPPALADADDAAGRVASALDAWDDRPTTVVLDPPTSEELELELGRLPAMPTGDLDPAAEVLDAKAEYDRRLEARRLVGDRPEQVAAGATASPDAMTGEPAGPEASTGAAPRPTSETPAGPADRRWLALAVAALVVALVGVAALSQAVAVGVGLLALAVVLGVGAGLARRAGATSAGAVAHRGAAEAARLETDRREAELAAAERDRVAREAETRLAEWSRLGAERTAALEEARSDLTGRLAEHGTAVAADADLVAAFERYLADCRTRAALARDAARGPDLRSAIDARRDLERNAATVAERLGAIETQLRTAAADVGIVGGTETDPEMTAAALRAWQEHRGVERRAAETATLEWRELETLLGDRTLADLEADATSLAELARDRADGLDPDRVETARTTLGPDPDRRIAERQAATAESRAEADRLAGRLAQVERGLPSVAEAEELLAAADVEVVRVTGLDEILQTTMTLLREAERRIHRDLAPVLGGAIAAHLPSISGGRYVEAAVDPADLAVTVKAAADGRWRDARRLSHGTREQIYLLLRLAMTEQLVRDGEVAPLLCDEVTVQSDEGRATRLLDLLHEVSAERQVVVFTHDERALAWAEGALHGEPDRLIRLDEAA